MNQVFCAAISEMKLLTFNYHGHSRTVEPHTYGIDAKGHESISAYQVSGTSQSQDVPDWKIFHTSDMLSVSTSQQHFAKPRDGYRKGDKRMTRIFCEL